MSWRAALVRRARALSGSRGVRVAFGVLVIAFCTAPVPGDAGGCTQGAAELDAGAFFSGKQRLDCERCRECGLRNDTCGQACAVGPVPAQFPEGCIPLVHDGEVCLRALEVASCDAYASYVRDQGASTPTECDFCPRRDE